MFYRFAAKEAAKKAAGEFLNWRQIVISNPRSWDSSLKPRMIIQSYTNAHQASSIRGKTSDASGNPGSRDRKVLELVQMEAFQDAGATLEQDRPREEHTVDPQSDGTETESGASEEETIRKDEDEDYREAQEVEFSISHDHLFATAVVMSPRLDKRVYAPGGSGYSSERKHLWTP